MFINTNPDDFVTTMEQHICPFHKAHPDIRDYPGCSCSAAYGLRKATPEEKKANEARRMVQQADRDNARRSFGWPPR